MEIKTKIEEGMRRFLMVFMLGVLLGGLGCRGEDSMVEQMGEGFGGVGVVDIASVSDFEKIRSNPGGDFRITESINFEGSRFTPIPNFTGTLDGGGNSLVSLKQDLSTTDNVGGIFKTINGQIKDLTLESFKVGGRNQVGLLGGTLGANGKLTNINVQAGETSLTGNEDVGGLVGVSLGGYIGYSRVWANINATGDNVGGLVGRLGASSMVSRGKVNIERTEVSVRMVKSTGNNVGGLVGRNYIGNIDGSSAVAGEIRGNDWVGGLVGSMSNLVSDSPKLKLTNSSGANVRVIGNITVGGLVGIGDSIILSNLRVTGGIKKNGVFP